MGVSLLLSLLGCDWGKEEASAKSSTTKQDSVKTDTLAVKEDTATTSYSGSNTDAARLNSVVQGQSRYNDTFDCNAVISGRCRY